MFDTLTRLGASGIASTYEINRSVRLNNNTDDSRFEWTPSGAGNTKVFTFSCWVKRSMLGVNSQYLMRTDTTVTDRINFDASDRLELMCRDTSLLVTTRKFRDTNAWYHILCNTNTDNGTANDRHQIWINGVRETAFDTNANLSGLTIAMNAAGDHHVGGDGSDGFGGYMAEVHLIDGQQIDASNFGETDTDTGQWKPKKYTGSYGTNGFYLNFSDNSGVTASTLGKDSSGNGNNFTPQNFSVSAGAGNDSFEDTPSNNWCTLNPNDNGSVTLSDGNLVTNVSSGFKLVKSTFFLTSGKWYWEVVCTDTGNGFVGVSDQTDPLTTRGGDNANSCTIRSTNGHKRISGSTSSYGSAISDGDVMMFAVDMDAGKFWAGKSGTWFDSGNPATGANAGSTAITNPVSPCVALYDNEDYTMNFGANMDFAHTPPTGFNKINTSNLPDPTITKPSDHFDIVTYTGNGSTQTFSTLSFQPELVWIKERNAAENHCLYDAMRGATLRYIPNSTADDDTLSDGLTAFTANGFSVGANDSSNTNTHTYVAFCWNGGSAAVAETAGTINSSVRANTTAGFSNLSYTGNATAGATVEHGLNAVPQWMIIKRTSDNWIVYHHKTSSSPEDDYYEWQGSGGKSTSGAFMWNNTLPTSTLFTLYSDGAVNASSTTIYWWGWSGVEGFSKFGNYTGNGAADGPFVFTGFKPAFVMVKSGGHWIIWHNKVEGYNPTRTALLSNATNAEEALDGWAVDLYSNGFKLRGTDASANESGSNFIYMAFAERPFKYANAR